MDALYFLCSIIGIGVVMRWLIINDKVAPEKPSLEKPSVPPSRSRL